MRALVLLSILVAGLGCTPTPPIPPVTPTTDAGAPSCASACATLRALRCPAAETTPRGATCVDVCQNVQSSGIVAFDLPCLARARTCAEASACPSVAP